MRGAKPAPTLAMLEGIRSRLVEMNLEQTEAAVYFLCEGENIVYIGQARNPYARVPQHRIDGKRFDRCLLLHLPADVLDRVEGALIRVLRPPLNKGAPCVEDPESVLCAMGITQ